MMMHVSRLFYGIILACFCCFDLVHDCGKQVRQDISTCMCVTIEQAMWPEFWFEPARSVAYMAI